MGVEYYVVDREKKIFYDLGKGGWYRLNDDKEAFQDQEYLANYILTECFFNLDHYPPEERERLKEWIETTLAPELFSFFGDSKKENIFVFNDSGDDITICKAKRYRCVGTRHGETLEEKQEDIDRMNRHLVDNELNRRWYDPESYKIYPEWSIY
jgi:hypothetical protein